MSGRWTLRPIVFSAILVLSVLGGLLLYVTTVPLAVRQTTAAGPPVTLAPGERAAQTFRANYAGLWSISLMGVSDRTRPTDLDLELRAMRVADGEEPIVTSTLSQNGQGAKLRFEFPPIVSSADVGYEFTVINRGDESVTLARSEANMYPEGELIDQGGDLVFEARFRPPPLDGLAELGQQLTEHKPGVLHSPFSYMMVLVAMFGAAIRLTWAFVNIGAGWNPELNSYKQVEGVSGRKTPAQAAPTADEDVNR